MRINRINVQNMIAVRSAEIKTDASIQLICGSNEAGKSSMYEGIIHALTGESTRVSLKKNYKHLVNDNDTVGYTQVEFDDDRTATITLPNGTHELKESLHYAINYVLTPALFANSSADVRGKLLFDLGNLRSDGAEVKQKLLDRKCDADKVGMIMPFLKSSFENAEKHATENVKQSRANWKAETGEVYGEIKAGLWKIEPPVIDPNILTDAKMELVAIDEKIEAANQKLGALQAQINGSSQRAGEIQRLENESVKIDRIKAKLSKDRTETMAWLTKVEDTRRMAEGSVPGAVAVQCPSCKAELTYNGKELIERKGDLHGDEESAVKLPEYEQTLTMFRNSVKNGERDLANAENAKLRLDELKKEAAEVISEERVTILRTEITTLKEGRTKAQNALDLINKNIKAATEAESKTKKAAGHHADVMAWDLIARSLATDGIPGEMLLASLEPLNNRLNLSSKTTGWKRVTISPDMSISYDERPYSLSSASAKWRANLMIAEAISHISGIKFFMCDEFDLLDLPGRNKCLGWLVSLAKFNEIDTVMVFGTMKALPTGLPTSVQANWIENGVIQERKAEAA
ncbi:MAG: AAA family ATPase [Nitrosomonas sp.]|uniref:AAA family ATPase n=1 Tax=Nitrosomonas sp. TaxID=42353 RepID=UPI0025F26B40|nr:AAA family ATPase [Nitrosomonas sp.]MBY0475456.1 AAA family ATPase [Nitrosomonas sp.]